MAKEARPSVGRLLEVLTFNPDTGSLVWRRRNVADFPSIRSHKIWNTRFAGKPALRSKRKDGYLVGSVDGAACYAHRVCWAMISGAWPVGEVDHINGDRTDNRATNLRDVGRGENTRNKQVGVRNQSGALGVMLDHTGHYRVRISDNYKSIELGRYRDFDEAVSVRKAAEAALSYHENHGRRVAA